MLDLAADPRRSVDDARNPGLCSLTMSVAQLLQNLYSLDTSSLTFSRQLYCLIQSDDEERYLTGLQGSELVRLVDFLDGVRALSSASC